MITLRQQIAAVEHEIELRETTLQDLIDKKILVGAHVQQRTDELRAVLETLKGLQATITNTQQGE